MSTRCITRSPHSTPQRRGSALVLAVILSVVITSIVLVAAWGATTIAQAGNNLSKMDQALYAAESGAATVTWYCKNNKMGLITSPLTGSINGATYSTSWATVSGSTIRVTSTGTRGSVVSTVAITITPPTYAPAVTSGGDFNGKNITITGDVQTNGNYSSAGTGTVNGNLICAGTASNLGSVTGTVTHATPPSLSIPTVVSTLQAAAGLTLAGNQNNKTFDFTAIAGTNKVIYVSGNVNNPTFIGSGTLCAGGTISAGSFGTSTNPVNLVALGSITTSNNITIYGTVYSNGDWNRGSFNMTGLVYVTGVVATNSGTSSITETSAPWFDTRSSGAGGGSWPSGVITNFTGPSI